MAQISNGDIAPLRGYKSIEELMEYHKSNSQNLHTTIKLMDERHRILLNDNIFSLYFHIAV